MTPAAYEVMHLATAVAIAVSWMAITGMLSVVAGDFVRDRGATRAQARAMVIISWIASALIGAFGMQAVLS